MRRRAKGEDHIPERRRRAAIGGGRAVDQPACDERRDNLTQKRSDTGNGLERNLGDDRHDREGDPRRGGALEEAHRIFVPGERVLPRNGARMEVRLPRLEVECGRRPVHRAP